MLWVFFLGLPLRIKFTLMHTLTHHREQVLPVVLIKGWHKCHVHQQLPWTQKSQPHFTNCKVHPQRLEIHPTAIKQHCLSQETQNSCHYSNSLQVIHYKWRTWSGVTSSNLYLQWRRSKLGNIREVQQYFSHYRFKSLIPLHNKGGKSITAASLCGFIVVFIVWFLSYFTCFIHVLLGSLFNFMLLIFVL